MLGSNRSTDIAIKTAAAAVVNSLNSLTPEEHLQACEALDAVTKRIRDNALFTIKLNKITDSVDTQADVNYLRLLLAEVYKNVPNSDLIGQEYLRLKYQLIITPEFEELTDVYDIGLAINELSLMLPPPPRQLLNRFKELFKRDNPQHV